MPRNDQEPCAEVLNEKLRIFFDEGLQQLDGGAYAEYNEPTLGRLVSEVQARGRALLVEAPSTSNEERDE
jgi:hypothetical protein